jgi:hypothetical protein
MENTGYNCIKNDTIAEAGIKSGTHLKAELESSLGRPIRRLIQGSVFCVRNESTTIIGPRGDAMSFHKYRRKQSRVDNPKMLLDHRSGHSIQKYRLLHRVTADFITHNLDSCSEINIPIEM